MHRPSTALRWTEASSPAGAVRAVVAASVHVVVAAHPERGTEVLSKGWKRLMQDSSRFNQPKRLQVLAGLGQYRLWL